MIWNILNILEDLLVMVLVNVGLVILGIYILVEFIYLKIKQKIKDNKNGY